jgi:arylsulfatase A
LLASQGMTFTDAHSGSSVCTPTRYGLMTGRYSWRTRLQKGVCSGFAPCWIAEDRPTVASFLKSQGYATAIVGKWHLNCLYLDPKTGEQLKGKDYNSTAPVGAKVPDGPVNRGFDFFHGIHHARSMKAIIENDRVIEHDDVINFLPRCEKQSVQYVDSRKGNSQPFFLYVPLGSPHTPIVPTDEWTGKSGLGKYGDFVMQTDHVVGEIMQALDRNGFAENTLVFFTSDNGCSKAAGIPNLAEQGHKVSAHLRGSKADIWDGGHRVPFFVRWPGRVKPGSNCDQLICHTDLFSTIGDILNVPVPSGSCEDSVSILPSFSGHTIKSSRVGVVHHSISGHFAFRSGKWKLLLAKASGGWSSPKENQVDADAPKAQLYDMSSDVGEQRNLYLEKPEVADKLLQQLTAYVYNGRSTAGPESPNDVDQGTIKLWKSEK